MKAKNSKELIMNNDDLLASLIILLNTFEDKITKDNKKIVLAHIERLKNSSKIICRHSFVANVKMGEMELMICNGAVQVFSKKAPYNSMHNLKQNKEYRVTIEELIPERKTKKTKK